MNIELKTLAIVVPCYNEAEGLLRTCDELRSLLENLCADNLISRSSSICFVDDGSSDKTWGLIDELAQKHRDIHGIKLSNNFGQQSAMLAGLFSSNEDIVITIDADLQDDLTVVYEMVKKTYDGYSIVYGARQKRDGDTWFKKNSAQFFYKFMSFMGIKLIYNHSEFRLMDRQSINALKQFEEVNLFLKGLVPYLGFKHCIVYYDRKKRLSGETKYSLLKLINLAWEGITSFSIAPLRMITMIGFVIFIASMILGLWALYQKIILNNSVAGWTSIVVPLYLLGGVQILTLGIIGEYIGKIYKESKGRPRFIIEKTT